MKSYSDLVNKHFKVYKKRSILTIVGIISSIILFFTIGYIKNYAKDIETINGINIVGDYDAVLYDVSRDDAIKIANNIKVDKYGFYNEVDEYELNLGNVSRTMYIYKIDEDSIKDIFYKRIKINEGRFPKTDSEIMLTYSLKKHLNVNLNDTFDSNGKLYTIVGFYEPGNDYGINNLCGLTNLDKESIDKKSNVIIKVKNRKDKENAIKEIATDVGINIGDIYNRENIYLNGFHVKEKKMSNTNGMVNFDEVAISYATLNMFVLFLTIILTHGSINISLNERKKEFATLRCIGATPSKIKYLLIKESLILGVFSLLPGIFIAQIIAWIITYVLSNMSTDITYELLNGKIYYSVIRNTFIFIAVNIFLSTIIPLKNVSKISPINIIKNKTINNNKIRRRNPKLIRKLFGYTGELAYKNIRANNSGFIINIITLTTILIVSVCFTGYKNIADKFYDQNINRVKDISITFNPQRYEEDENISIEDITDENERFVRGFEELNIAESFYTSLRIESNLIIEDASLSQGVDKILNIQTITQNGKEALYGQRSDIYVLSNEYMKRILKSIDSSNKGKINENDFIVLNTITEQNPFSKKKLQPLNLIDGDEVNLYISDKENIEYFKGTKPIKMNYRGTIERTDLIGTNSFSYLRNLAIIVSEDFYINNKERINSTSRSVLNIFFDIDKNQDEDNVMRKLNEYVIGNDADYIEEKSSELEYKEEGNAIFNMVYLGIGLVVLISSINLINIRSINMSLREKEFKILLSVGMKKSKLKSMIFLEGIVTWFISSIIGSTISVIILIIMWSVYNYQGYLSDKIIPFGIILTGIFILLVITTVINVVPYRRFKKIDLNGLIEEEE